MKLSTNDIIDSLRETPDSLSAIGIKMCQWQEKPIVISCEDSTIAFKVTKSRTPYKMTVWLESDFEQESHYEKQTKWLSLINCGALVGYEYHHRVLNVKTFDGREERCSFVLEEIPSGETLKDWFEQEIHTSDEKQQLADRLIECAQMLLDSELHLRNIKPHNIVIQPDGRIKLTDYRKMTRLTAKSQSIDSKVLLAIAVVALLSSQGILSPETDSSLSNISRLMQAIDSAQRRGALSPEEHQLIKSGIDTGDLSLIGKLKQTVCKPATEVRHKYEIIGQYVENVAVAQHKGKFGYIDRDGNALTEFKYTMADDVYEGYAIVGIGKKLGLIHKSGKEILAAEYEDILLPGDCGMLVYRRNVLWSIRSLTGTIYGDNFDSVSIYSPGILKVSKYKLWGLMDSQGRVLIPFIYEELHKISDNRCRLKINDHYLIWQFRKE